MRRGHSVEVVHCEDAYNLQAAQSPHSEAADDGILVHRLRSPYGFLSPLITQQTGSPGLKRRALERIFSRDFDVINFHNLSLVGGLGAIPLSRAAATLYTLHEHWLLCATHIFWKNGREACKTPDCFTCTLRSGRPPQLWRSNGLRNSTLRHVDLFLSPSEYTMRRHIDGGVDRPIRVLPTYSPLDPGPIAPNPGPAQP